MPCLQRGILPIVGEAEELTCPCWKRFLPAQLPDQPRKESHVRALASAVGVKLVEHQELESLGGSDQLVLPGPCEHQLEHHVVGQQDVRRIGDDLLPFLVGLLTRVAAEGHQRRPVRIAVAKELLQLTQLAVRQGVHRVDDDRLNASPAAASEDVIYDRHYVGEALSRAGTSGQDVMVTGPCGPDALDLVLVEAQRSFIGGRSRLLAEDPQALPVEQALVNEVLKRLAGLKVGIELDQRVGPQAAALELPVDERIDPPVPDRDEAPDIGAVLADDPIAKLENIHGTTTPCSAEAGPALRRHEGAHAWVTEAIAITTG